MLISGPGFGVTRWRRGSRDRRGRREPQLERGAAALGIALAADAAAVRYHDLLREGKAEPGAALLGRVEEVEDPVALLGADPGALVVDADGDAAVGPPHRERGGAAAGHR